MALNPNYVPLTPLWEVFTDKDLLTFLSGGYVKFYVDTARTVGKPVYQLTGSPPNYSYTQYGFLETDGSWRVNMNLQGAFDQVIYGYPIDEFGEVQLYFADFFNVDDVFQFSREGFPNFFASGGTISTPVDINFIPDGQFRLHTDIPATSTLMLGQVREPITQIAFGGWTFERPMASVARDFVTFQRIGSFVTNPIKSPRYAVEATCEAPNAGDTFKDLRVKFDDVNKFSSDTDMYTFGFTGKVVSSGSVNVELIIIKNYGTGGDATTETDLTTFTLTTTFTPFSYSFVFGSNIGKIIGPFEDDFVQIALRFPTNELFDIEITDALLTPGNIIAPIFNDTTTREFLYESLFDDMACPSFNGNDIGLPLILTKTGLQFDHSQIGFIFPSSSYAIPFGYLEADGSVSYDSTLHSSDGIPYSRLSNNLTVSLSSPLAHTIPVFGTGPDFITCDILDSLDIKISTNIKGSTSTPSDGVPATGFTFRNNHIGQINVDAKGYLSDSNNFLIISDKVGEVNDPGFTIGVTFVENINGSSSRSIFTFTLVSIAAGQYLAFGAGENENPYVVYYVWFKVDGVGTDPAYPGALPIEVDLFSGISLRDKAKIISDSISGKQVSQITTVAGSSIPPGSYFNINTLTQSYYIWYQVNGSGTDPMPFGKIGIMVPILSSDTKDQVTSKTVTAINSRYFATPDLRGIFLKGYNGFSGIDLNSVIRYSSNSVITGDAIGTLEYSDNISHDHGWYTEGGSLSATIPNTTTAWTPTGLAQAETDQEKYLNPLLQNQGSSESRPQNIYVHYLIKY